MPRQIQRGDSWFQTQLTELAAVFVALDFDFWDPEAACDIRKQQGVRKITWFFNMKNQDESLHAKDVFKAWKKYESYLEENPNCRIGSAIAAVKNLRIMNEGIKKSPTLIGYKLGGKEIWVVEGSEGQDKLKQSSRAKEL